MPRKTRADLAWGAFVLSAALGLSAYVAFRAWSLSFTHDESFSYNRYVHLPTSWIVLSRETDANHHPLNSLAMKLGDGAFGSSEIALRWASLAAFVVYVVAMTMLVRRIERRTLRLLALSLAIANPYVLDFFSIARGYGLALALVAAASLFTIGFAERPTVRAALAAVVCAAGAVMANFAALDFFLAVLVGLLLALLVPPRTDERRVAPGRLGAAVALPTVGVALLAGIPLLRLRSEGELYFGGDDGFWQDTVRSVVASTLYRRGGDPLELGLVALVAIAAAVGTVSTVVALRRRTLPPHATAFVLLAVPAVASVAQHLLVDSLFLIERTALFFVPLFAIWLGLAADALARRPGLATGVTAAAAVIVVVACVNLASAANLSYVLDWRYDASTERAIDELAAERGDRVTVDLGTSWLFEPTTNFYRETRYPWFVTVPGCRSDCLERRFDYYYVVGPDIALVEARGARVLRAYPLSDSVLARDPGRPG